MPFKIIRNDITKMDVDVIVNTANAYPIYSSGTDAAVYHAAGADDLLSAREKIGVLEEGDVALTLGYALKAKYILHAVSPVYIDGKSGEKEKLRRCYRTSLQMAVERHCRSIAFPLISTGSFGYPKEEGMRIALDEINAFLLSHDLMVYLVVFDEESTSYARHLYRDLEAYIDRHYVEQKLKEEYVGCYAPVVRRKPARSSKRNKISDGCASKAIKFEECECFDHESLLKERIKHLSDTFQQYLFYLMEQKGLSNADVYKKALISKQTFSKIKLNPQYHPDKNTALKLCVGAHLSLDETRDLLARAGYALSPCDKTDIIFSFFIEHEIYDMIEIDIALEEHGLPCFIS